MPWKRSGRRSARRVDGMTATRWDSAAARPALGAHVSVAGGLELAFERAARIGCEAIQVFVKSPSRWALPPVDEGSRGAFVRARRRFPGFVGAHAAYLINLAAGDRTLRRRSVEALGEELRRCGELGIDALVVHPGSHLGAGVAVGLERVAQGIEEVVEIVEASTARGSAPVRLLIENTAGGGNHLGADLEQLETLLARCALPVARLGVCLDTCHAFAAGVPIHRARGLQQWLDELSRGIGLERVGLRTSTTRGRHSARGATVMRTSAQAPSAAGPSAASCVIRDCAGFRW
ncbi:MAG: deoxyribonuclease IV [Acidobacteria bacterium]|nr:MAG: deoxyribonuclease IV [Acidobacteriota bacterium]